MTPPFGIVPCVWLNDQAEPAAAFYQRTFASLGSQVTAISHYPENLDNPSGLPRGSILTVEMVIADQRFTFLNGGPAFSPNPSISFFVRVATPEEAERLFGTLREWGEVLMDLGTYAWSPRYGWVRDRFGVSWQVMATARAPGSATIVPCLMFSGAQSGRAEEAMNQYTRVFPDSRIDTVARYAAGEGPEGKVKHGQFTLGDQEMIAMDGHVPHDVTFNEGLSLQVICRDQNHIDRTWAALGDGGQTGRCGWLKDRFGLSWQVVPKEIGQWMASNDVQARDRAFAAMLKMGKPDVAALTRAFAGG
jgi:predicted 3-demethylubiquinone-9 3-methyltransferase (glyoxalase superfamily)